MQHELSLKQLQAAARDMNTYFDPPLKDTETDTEALIAEITENAKDLQPDDDLDPATKTVLKALGVGPWLEAEETKEIAPEPDFTAPVEEEEDAEDEGVQEEKPKKVQAGASRYGHRAHSMSAAIDELVWKGTTFEDACKSLEAQFKKSKKAVATKFKLHVQHLIKEKGVAITIKDNHYKATK
jgi:predicted RNase H-like nuclease (RuvC/YqgF family)